MSDSYCFSDLFSDCITQVGATVCFDLFATPRQSQNLPFITLNENWYDSLQVLMREIDNLREQKGLTETNPVQELEELETEIKQARRQLKYAEAEFQEAQRVSNEWERRFGNPNPHCLEDMDEAEDHLADANKTLAKLETTQKELKNKVDAYNIKLSEHQAVTCPHCSTTEWWCQDTGETFSRLVSRLNIILNAEGLEKADGSTPICSNCLKKYSLSALQHRYQLWLTSCAKSEQLEILASSLVGKSCHGRVDTISNAGIAIDLGVEFAIGLMESRLVTLIDKKLISNLQNQILNNEYDFTISDVDAPAKSIKLECPDLTYKIQDIVNWYKEQQRQEREAKFQEAKTRLKIGDILTGTVCVINKHKKFALVDLGGYNGILHISEIANHFIEDISTELDLGQEVTVLIKSIEERGLSLSMKNIALHEMQEEHSSTNETRIGHKNCPENGISQGLKLDIEEGKTVEFKSSIIYSAKTGKPDVSQFDIIARTLASFMNCEGGDLYIGIHDETGCVMGIERDFDALNTVPVLNDNGHPLTRTYKQTKDGFNLKLTDILVYALGKNLAERIDLKFNSDGNHTYALVHVDPLPRPEVAYVHDDIYVRINASTRKLEGRERDNFIISRYAHCSKG